MKIFKNKVFLGILCIMAGLVAGYVSAGLHQQHC